MTSTFDPLEMSDPYGFYRRARREHPIFFHEQSGYWVVTKYADVRNILADETRFSAEAERESYARLSPAAVAVLEPIDFTNLYGLSTTENPAHDRIKKVALPLFNDLYLSKLLPSLQSLADEYLDEIDGCEEVDLVSAVCDPFPAAAIFKMLGIPGSDLATVKKWSASRIMLTWGDPDEQVAHACNIVNYWNYCRDLVARKIDDPEDDLPSALGAAVLGGRLTLREVELFCYGLMFSGHATTSAFLAESIRVLLASKAWNELTQSEVSIKSIGSTADELLRLCPSAFTRRRLVLSEVMIRNQRIPKGAVLLLAIGSANRDEDVFSQPDSLQFDRKNASKHLSFGHGFHYCIGAKIVKLEYSILLERIARRFPYLSLSEGHFSGYKRNLSIRAPDSLFVCF